MRTFEQRVDTFDLFNTDQAVTAGQASDDILPAFSATFINYEHQFRIAYSETLSRPDFRELSPAAFTNPVTGREVIGNPDLEVTSIQNYDFRWEWYFGFNDYVSFGLFYKEFELPIESTVRAGPSPAGNLSPTPRVRRTKAAEFEFYKRLDFLGGRWEDFYVQGNVSYIESSVEIKEEDKGVLTEYFSSAARASLIGCLMLRVGYETLLRCDGDFALSLLWRAYCRGGHQWRTRSYCAANGRA